MKSLLEELNPEQLRAVKTSEGPLLILAGAGSGKTKTLTHRLAYILSQRKATPFNILAVTFTNKAAGEMRARVASLLGNDPENRGFMPFMGTFHSICVRILRRDGQAIGIPSNFVIWDETDRLAAIKQVCRQLNIDEKKFPPRMIAAYISGAKNEMVSHEEFAAMAANPATRTAAKVFPLYEKSLSDAGALDFDDLIGRTVELLNTQEEIHTRWQKQFKYVMVDEYQDTNSAQYQLVKLLTGSHRNIAVVGDDWQSIYSWRGADFRNILNFEQDFPGSTVIKLEQNYRSTKNILDAAHNVIKPNRQRSDKKLWTAAGAGAPVQILQVANERAEAEAIVRRLRSSVDSRTQSFKDFAVLYRTNAQSRALEEVFVHYGIPYRIVGGVRFYDRKEIKDILAYLRLIYQPEDMISFERIINVPSRSIGPRSLEVFFKWRINQGYGLAEGMSKASECQDLTPRARSGLMEVGNIINTFRPQIEELSCAALIDKLLRRIDYLHYLEDGTPQGEARIENVRELLTVAAQYQELGLAGFLEEVALISDLDDVNISGLSKNDKKSKTSSKDVPDSVTLMTLHSAKGLEFPIVFITGMEETILPHSRALYEASELEEERRLIYVGMTRAKKELYLIHALERRLYGGRLVNPPSRFLADIEVAATKSALQISEVEVPDTAEPRYVLDLAEGDGVRHKVFGVGTVVELEGDIATIYFKGRGTKRLDIGFAPLEKV